MGWALCSRNNEREAIEARTKEANTNTVPLIESRQHTSAFVGICAVCQHTWFSECEARTKEANRNILATLSKFEGGFWCLSSEKMSVRGSKK